MTQTEALKLALEALEEAWYHVGTFQPTEKAIDLYDEARTAIKEALAQPEQEPMHPELRKMWEDHFDKCFRAGAQRTWVGLTEKRIKEIWLSGKDHGDDWTDVLALARSFEAELKELNK